MSRDATVMPASRFFAVGSLLEVLPWELGPYRAKKRTRVFEDPGLVA